MDYQKIYNQLIEKARIEKRVKSKEKYYEAHHIIPKCIGGEGETYSWKTHPNIILLTAKEHFISHRLLCLIYPDNKKLLYGLWRLMNARKNYDMTKVISSRSYETLKREFAEHIGNISTGRPMSEESKRKRTLNTDYKAIVAKMDYKSFQHKVHTKEAHIKKAANHDYKKSSEKMFKPLLQLSINDELIKEWSSRKEASESLNILGSGITRACDGTCIHAYGFKWKYKEDA